MMASRKTPHIGFSFENLMWIFTRISGAALILMCFFGLAAALWMGARNEMDAGALARWTFFPESYHVQNTDIPDLKAGWLNAFWQVIQILIAFFAVSHGVNGLRNVLEDYMGTSWRRVFLRGFLLLFWLFMLIVAVYVVLTVTPEPL
jgi:succinate dehydrogenase membrane anchor subunit